MAFGYQSLSSLYSKSSLWNSFLMNSLAISERILHYILDMFSSLLEYGMAQDHA